MLFHVVEILQGKLVKWLGLEVPVIPVEHQYIVTDDHPEILKRKEQGLPEMGVLETLIVHGI